MILIDLLTGTIFSLSIAIYTEVTCHYVANREIVKLFTYFHDCYFFRGGALLKDQNMHNYITKNLPKLEAELLKLDNLFEKEHGKRIKIHGKTIQSIIEDSRAEAKEKRSAKIKAKVNSKFM